MKAPAHPSSLLSSKLVDDIRKFSGIAEKSGGLTKEQLTIVYQHRWFNLFVPKDYNGLELSLPDALQLEEALAWLDGSLGWTVTLCSGANWFVGFLAQGVANDIFKDPRVCLAGSGRASGIARVMNNGYEINGSWNYATGASHATVFTANCMIEKEGAVVYDKKGDPLILSFWFWKDEVSINRNWHSMGLVATASHGFEVKNLQVAANRSFVIAEDHAFLQSPIYHFPFLQFAETTLAVNLSGMTIFFLDLSGKLFMDEESNRSRSQDTIAAIQTLHRNAVERVEQTRKLFYKTVELAWAELLSAGAISVSLLSEISRNSLNLATTSRQAVDELYPFCGMVATEPASPINRVWRDIHTASQHVLLRPFH